MASAGVGAAAAAGVFTVPYVGWAVGLAAAYIDSAYIYPALAGSPDEPLTPQLANLPTSEQGPGAPRVFAIGKRMRLPAHAMYQSTKAREESAGGGKGGTDVSLKRVYVNALLHLNDRESSGLLQLIGNGQLLLFNERNLIGVTSENLSAAVSSSSVVVSLVDEFDPDFRDTFKVGDLIKANDFVRVAGPTTWNGTYYEVTAITGATPGTGSTMTVSPVDGQSVASLSYTGGTTFSPASVVRVDDAVGGSSVTLSKPFSSVFLHIKNPGKVNPGDVFAVNDRVRVRNANLISVGNGNNNPIVGQVRRVLDAGATLEITPDTPPPTINGTVPVNVPALSGKSIIVDFDEAQNFTNTIFPQDFDSIVNYNAGFEDQGQPRVLLTDYGSTNTSAYRGMATQGLVDCYVSAFGDQLPTNLEAIIEIDDDLTWSQAIEMLLQRGDLLNTQIETSSITPRPFRGSYVRGTAPVLQQVQPALVAGELLTQDCNGVVRVFDIDNADSVQIENGATFSDLGARMFGQQMSFDKVQSDDKAETSLPTSISVRFQDPDNAYTIGYEHFGLRNPSGTNHVNEQQMNLTSLVLSRREARNLATTLMRRAYVNRRTYRMTLPSAYIHLLENDLITFTDDEGEVITARIIQRDIGSNFLVNITALREMTQLSVAGSPVQSSSQVVPQQTGTTTALAVTAIDAPAVANSEINTPAIRLGVADLSGNLQTATVWESQDGNSYQPVGTIGGTCALGFLLSELTAQTSSEAYGTNTVSLRAQTVSVFWSNTGSDVLEACTQAQAESGKNWCAIIGTASEEVEIAAFTTVVNNGDGTYTLGGWLRGLRGTPSPAQSDKTLVMMNQSVGGLFLREFSGPTPTSLAYKVVPSGGDLATTNATTVTAPKFRNVLPLPLRSVTRVYNSTALTTRFEVAAHWERQLLPLGTQPPHTMDEPFESYRINIYQHGSTDAIAATYLMDSRTTGASTLRDSYFDWSNARATAAGYTPGPSETYYVSYQQVGEYGDGPLRFETI